MLATSCVGQWGWRMGMRQAVMPQAVMPQAVMPQAVMQQAVMPRQ